jgi:tripartite-type tricarboxylate transporter receptor subunit TctC
MQDSPRGRRRVRALIERRPIQEKVMIDTQRRRLLQGAAALTGIALVPRRSAAAAVEDFPDHALRLIIPYPPGGAGDIVARMISPGLGQALGQPIVDDNRPGGAQIIATQLAVSAPPDGYTLYLSSTTLSVNPTLMRHLNFDTLNDFAPITIAASSPLVFVAHPSLGVSNIKELVAYAKAHPGAINYGSSGPGTGGHLSVELLKYMAGIDMVHVPYKGAGPALMDLIAGVVKLVCTSPLPAMPQVRDGKLKALGMTSAKRSPIAPDLPTVAEQGYAGYKSSLWYALLTQARTPAPVQRRIYDAAMKTLNDPKLTQQFQSQGAEVIANSPREAHAFIAAEIRRWGDLIERIGLKGSA